MRFTAVLVLIAGFAGAARGQTPAAHLVAGAVTTSSGPLRDANVFLLETLEGATSDALGRFSFHTGQTDSATLVVQRIGYRQLRLMLRVDTAGTLALTMVAASVTLAPITAVASRYTAGDERGATLTTLDVLSMPGAQADVARALQTFPGVQAVDEGTGLFVRGGDYTETITLLDGARLPVTASLLQSNGTFIGTVDPFLLDGITFLSGGFGAQYGNALSGVAALHTMGRPTQSTATLGAGLAALSGAVAVALPSHLGVRAAANHFNTSLLFRVNGSTQAYDPAPQGDDRSGSIIYAYRPSGEVKGFGIAQTNTLGAEIADPSFVGGYHLETRTTATVASWRDRISTLGASAYASTSSLSRGEDYGAFHLQTDLAFRGGGGAVEWEPDPRVTARVGGQLERTIASLDGSIPSSSQNKAPGARTRVLASDINGDRTSTYAETDLRPVSWMATTVGVRREQSGLATAATTDPRISWAVRPSGIVTLTGAWGVYHQLADPLVYVDSVGLASLPAMRAIHTILGVQLERAGSMVRLEAYQKRYTDLAQLTQDYHVAAGGVGLSRGADLLASGHVGRWLKWRGSYSYLRARRTDATTGVEAPAPFDISRTAVLITQQTITHSWFTSLGLRRATGRPYTPVVSAAFNASDSTWAPTYAPPMSERVPAFNRIDAGVTNLRSIRTYPTVLYLAVTNVLNANNIYAYRYSRDYQQRFEVRSLFNRSFYFGISVTAL